MANAAPANVTDNDSQRVRAFLNALEMRSLAEAEPFLAPGAVMHFPDAPPMYRLSELVDWAKTRYRHVHKTFHAIDSVSKENHTIVFCHGELSVKWLNGTTSTGVRFIDRFELIDGLITRQDVWNDLALISR